MLLCTSPQPGPLGRAGCRPTALTAEGGILQAIGGAAAHCLVRPLQQGALFRGPLALRMVTVLTVEMGCALEQLSTTLFGAEVAILQTPLKKIVLSVWTVMGLFSASFVFCL